MANDIISKARSPADGAQGRRKVLFDLWDSCWRNYVERGPRVINVLPPSASAKLIDAENHACRARRGGSATGSPASPMALIVRTTAASLSRIRFDPRSE